jgi:hypothetical protein
MMTGALRELEESYLIAELGFAVSAPLRNYAASRPGGAERRTTLSEEAVAVSLRSGAPARRGGGADQRR